jgi:hypothetical protein
MKMESQGAKGRERKLHLFFLSMYAGMQTVETGAAISMNSKHTQTQTVFFLNLHSASSMDVGDASGV